MSKTMAKYLLWFLVQIARFGIKSILWVIRTFRKGKKNLKALLSNKKLETQSEKREYYAQEAVKAAEKMSASPRSWVEIERQIDESFKVHGQKNPNREEPKYFNDFHEATTKAKLAEIAEWKKSPLDSESVLKNQERFKKEAERMEREQYGSFDYTSLTKKELDQLYHQIIDKALENYEYRLHVLFKWKINHEEFHYRAARSLAIRIRREEERLKKHEIIGEYFDKRWACMTPEEAKADRQWILDQGRLRNPN